MPETMLPVEFLFHLAAELGPRNSIESGPQGTRGLVNVLGGSFDGPKLRGTVLPPGGDWYTQRGDGSRRLDVRVTLRTDDGALILMTYQGIALRGRDQWIRTAPLFETGDDRYAWLNNVQAIGIGALPGGGFIHYEVYAVN